MERFPLTQGQNSVSIFYKCF